jgi:hypothetical protein
MSARTNRVRGMTVLNAVGVHSPAAERSVERHDQYS